MLEILCCDLPGSCNYGLNIRAALRSLIRIILLPRGVTVAFNGVRLRRNRVCLVLVRGALCNPRDVESGVDVDDNDSFVVRRGDEGSDQ